MAVQRELVALLRTVRSRFAQMARDLHPDVDTAAYSILHLVHTGQAATVTGLAELLGVGKPTISRQVSALEDLGLLQRECDAEDRRVVRLALTDDGSRRLGEAQDRRDEQFKELLEQWPVEDLSTFAGLLGRFNALGS